ncbi:MAG: pyruvate ferredoxin/flavodoxin oxidoreductase, partial [Bacteroidetes bacterium]|nr:pyruvate ferredoxin/flavodoxin oxidoreductase [Bacteroidota bacterium]
RIPFMHFFDGFRTSHEINKIQLIPDDQIKSMISDTLVSEHRARSLNPDQPFIRGTAQNPDVYFQGRETVNPFYSAAPVIVQDAMNQLGELTGRQYQLFEYYGHPQAERVAVVMGSGGEVLKETVRILKDNGEKVGVILVRLFRPFSGEHLLSALPDTVEKIVVLDRTKEPGAAGEPLYQDIITHICQAYTAGRLSKLPRIIGGRYGLSSKEFTPAMAKAVLDELKNPVPKHGFTIGINDDVTYTSIEYDNAFHIEPSDRVCALFYGLGADGTVGANKNSIKIIGEETDLYAQGYFVYDSRKSGTQTVSHLRFGKDPIRAPWLVDKADFIACHKYNFISKTDMLQSARPGATFLLNSPYPAEEVWDHLPRMVQDQLIDKQMKLFVIDASKVAAAAGMGQRINTIMQTCFFALSNVLPADEAIEQIKKFIRKSYLAKGEAIVQKNFKAVDDTLAHLVRVNLPASATGSLPMDDGIPAEAPAFVQEVTAMLLEGKGDLLPVSKMPIDGTYPTGTTKWEKRNIADDVPVWESDSCIQCGNCSFVCPHSVIRSKFYHESYLEKAPEGFPSAAINARGFPETRYTLQVYLEDCTGCKLCVQACPVVDIKDASRKAINMTPKPSLANGREHIRFFESMPVNNRAELDFSTVRGAQFLEPLFEFSGACAGCGETPYVKLLTQLYGDRLLVANATGCSSIYGGNLPTTPWSVNKDKRGPAWSNSLFEDNAEFGLGMRVAADKQWEIAQTLLLSLQPVLENDVLVDAILHAPQQLESHIAEQRDRVGVLKQKLHALRGNALAAQLLAVADHLVKRSVWLIGGDGWAYDIGSSGLDHVLSTGRNVNILVLDTEVYSNTGGQMSKATPTAAIAKFAAAGKKVGKKDLAMQAISYGNVYVAQIAMGANPQQTLLALREAEAYKGPSLILAYSHCIAHGIDMEKGLTQQQLAVSSGYWPLIRYNPALREAGKNPFVLDSPRPAVSFTDYAYNETRYKALATANPAEAKRLMGLAQELVTLRYKSYENMATWKAEEFAPVA